MAGIFGIIGDISKSNIFEKSLKYLDFYKSNSIIVNDHTLTVILYKGNAEREEGKIKFRKKRKEMKRKINKNENGKGNAERKEGK